MHGQWSLIRTGRPASGSKSQWLLFKRTDQFAITGNEAEVIGEDAKPRRSHAKKQSEALVKAKAAPKKKALRAIKGAERKPDFIPPELAQLVKEPPEGAKWVHETKFDGYRMQAHVERGKVSFHTRTGLDWSKYFPSIQKALENLNAVNAIIDGEAVWLDDEGRSNFQKLQNAMKAHDPHRIIYYAFDLLFLDGEDLRPLPLKERKHRLEKLIKSLKSPLIRYSDHIEGHAQAMFKAVCDYKLEGLISKNQESAYRSGRGGDWLKTKCKMHQEFVIGGFSEGSGSRAGGFGALLLGVYEGDKLRYAGKVGTGFTEKTLKELYQKFKKLEVKKSPFDLKSPKEKGSHWLKPVLAAEVSFGNWTDEGILRTPVFHGLREDKPVKDIQLEEKKPLKTVLKKTKSQKQVKPEIQEPLALTNPDRLLYEKEKITKKQVAEYYQEISKWILPHIADRPLALLRCPEGTSKDCFFQKHIAGKIPPDVTPISIKEKEKLENYLTIDSKEGLLSLSQMSAFELHAWGCRSDRIENPDLIVMDFDPGPGLGFKDVIAAAVELRDLLKDLRLKSFVCVSGGKGLHVHIPVEPIYSWEQIKSFSQTLAREMASRNPDRYTVNMSKKVRDKRIFIDYLRNGRGSTAVVPYSLRARKISAVAMPVHWEDLTKLESPSQFTLPKALQYLRKRKTDPWKDYFKAKQKISILKPTLFEESSVA
ncbi:DNA ligase D [Bdellovibrio bacteriovorus]|uniref:DNA ligase D n=1 Tax=Bdellovibrio bacteriovorus TaxID=959 RepID=UPI0035A5EA41